MEEECIERYRQRYETWRHLDKIRYQLVELATAFVGAMALVVQATQSGFPSWLFIILGAVFLVLWKILGKVNDAIVANGKALQEYGKAVGDDTIPDVGDRKSSIFYYVEMILLLVGAALVGLGIIFMVMAGAQ